MEKNGTPEGTERLFGIRAGGIQLDEEKGSSVPDLGTTPAGIPEPVTKVIPEPLTIGMTGTIPEKEKKTGTYKKSVIANPVRKIVRKTELEGSCVASSRMDPPQVRKRTERDLREPGAEVSYYKAETAFRDLVCTILERNDRMNEDIFLRINGLKHRVADIEDQLQVYEQIRTGIDREEKK